METGRPPDTGSARSVRSCSPPRSRSSSPPPRSPRPTPSTGCPHGGVRCSPRPCCRGGCVRAGSCRCFSGGVLVETDHVDDGFVELPAAGRGVLAVAATGLPLGELEQHAHHLCVGQSIPAKCGCVLASSSRCVRAAGFRLRIFLVLSLNPKCLSSRRSARRTVE